MGKLTEKVFSNFATFGEDVSSNFTPLGDKVKSNEIM
jgi:hypothetical protein